MIRSTYLLCFFLLAASLVGCGGAVNGSTGQSQSTTVSLQSQVTTGKPTIVFSQYTSATSLTSSTPMMDFSLKSISNANAGTMASDVNITSERITYEYIDSTPANLGKSLSIPPLTVYSNLIVPAGGTNDWSNVPVLLTAQKQYLKSNNVLTSATDIMRFKVIVTFNGVEIKNGSSISVSTTGTLILQQ